MELFFLIITSSTTACLGVSFHSLCGPSPSQPFEGGCVGTVGEVLNYSLPLPPDVHGGGHPIFATTPLVASLVGVGGWGGLCILHHPGITS